MRTRGVLKRINIQMSESELETLRVMAMDEATDMTEICRSALRLYLHVRQEQRRGKRMFIGDESGRIEREVVLL